MEIMPYTVAVQVMEKQTFSEAGHIQPTLWKCILSFTFNAHSQLLEMQVFLQWSLHQSDFSTSSVLHVMLLLPLQVQLCSDFPTSSVYMSGVHMDDIIATTVIVGAALFIFLLVVYNNCVWCAFVWCHCYYCHCRCSASSGCG